MERRISRTNILRLGCQAVRKCQVSSTALRSHEFSFDKSAHVSPCILQTLTHLRIAVNVLVGIMLGCVFMRSGADGSRVLDNYNLLFSILIHHMMTTMMLTIVTCKYPRASCTVIFRYSADGSSATFTANA